MLLYRILTALVLIPLVLLGIFCLPPVPFAYVSGIVFLMAGWEWAGLIGWASPPKRGLYLLLQALFFVLLLWIPTGLLLFGALASWLVLLYYVLQHEKFAALWQRFTAMRPVLGIWLLGASWYGLNYLQTRPSGAFYVLFLLLFIWGADTGAYFAGRRFGKHKLAPAVSPGKSWEGVLGGSLTSVLVAVLGGWFLFVEHRGAYFCFIVLAFLTSLISVLGDLVESLIKRQAGVKDSGNLLPGHGGLLDRIDSLVSAGPFFALGVLLFL